MISAKNESVLNTIEKLRLWTIKYNIPDVHLSDLLDILGEEIPQLKCCAKTFLKTSQLRFEITKIPDADEKTIGEFYYIGIRERLCQTVDVNVHRSSSIELYINMDGINLFKSSSLGFWPILGKIHYLVDIYSLFVIAIYCGNSKPKNLTDYLKDFVVEVNDLQLNGLKIDGKLFTVIVRCFICDTPARSFIKGIKYNGGYFVCERCNVKGEKKDGTMTYGFEGVKRTDDSFCDYQQPDHHRKISPITFIKPPIDMVRSFILDPMHLLDNGITCKLLNYWINGDKTTKISAANREKLALRLESIKCQIPCEYPRKPRSTQFLSQFKATEFRFIRLILGPIILRDLLNGAQYNHFMLFHIGTRILENQELISKYVNDAKGFLAFFCLMSKHVYGESSLVMNMRNLIHTEDDIEFANATLSEMLAYPFENFMSRIRNYIRSGNRPLSQFLKRYTVDVAATKQKESLPSIFEIEKQMGSGIKSLKWKGYFIRSVAPDNIVLLHTGHIFKISRILIQPNLIVVMEGQLCNKYMPITWL